MPSDLVVSTSMPGMRAFSQACGAVRTIACPWHGIMNHGDSLDHCTCRLSLGLMMIVLLLTSRSYDKSVVSHQPL